MAGERGEPLGLLAGDVDEQVAGGGDVGDVERLVGETRERTLGKGDRPAPAC